MVLKINDKDSQPSGSKAVSHISVQPCILMHDLKMFIFKCFHVKFCSYKKSPPVLNDQEIMRRKQVSILPNYQSKSLTDIIIFPNLTQYWNNQGCF